VVCFRAHCTQLRDSDRIAHAEINLIRKACKKLHCQSLADLVLVINAEPCSMCLSAAIKSGITYIYYGARMGQGANPYLLACDLVKLSRTKITLYPDILRNECEAQIAQARLQLKN